MTETSYALMLRKLSNDYYRNRIGFDIYRIERKILLDKIDTEFNGEQAKAAANENKSQSAFMQTIAFYQNSNVDK